MRRILPFLCVALLMAGCATVKTNRPDGTVVTYTGPANGATQLLDATDPTAMRSMEVAEHAIDKGQAASVTTRNAQVSTGYGFVGQQGYFPGAPMLPVLAPRQGADQPQVRETAPPVSPDECPDNGIPTNQRESLACEMQVTVWQLNQ